MAGKFVISPVKGDRFHFNLKAANGEIIATSEIYESLDAAKNGIESIRENAGAHIEDQTVEGFATLPNPKYEIYLDKAEQFRFRLRAPNGEIIATGEAYTAKASCKNGIASVGKNAPDAIVEEAGE